MRITIYQAASFSDIESCLNIRRKVFIDDQNVPEKDEIDGLDEGSLHYLVKLDTFPVGAARIRYVEGKAKIERVAILSKYQGQGLGSKLMKYLLQEIIMGDKVKNIILSAQTYAIPFYESLGFTVCSDEYMDAGIPHRNMQINVSKRMS